MCATFTTERSDMAAALKPQFVARAEKPVRASATHSRPQGETAADKGARVTARAVGHFQQNRRQWIATQYRNLLLKEAPGPEPRPPGMGESHASRLMRAATHLVERKQALRLDRISSAAERLASGRTSNQIGR
jgi:hypothetical protein